MDAKELKDIQDQKKQVNAFLEDCFNKDRCMKIYHEVQKMSDEFKFSPLEMCVTLGAIAVESLKQLPYMLRQVVMASLIEDMFRVGNLKTEADDNDGEGRDFSKVKVEPKPVKE